MRAVILALSLTLCSWPGSPTAAPLAYDLIPSWTAGLEDDLVFGRIGALEIHPSGALLVLDAQLGQVVVLHHDGTMIMTLGRAGEGPGEFNTPVGLYVEASGMVCVVQAVPPRIVRIGLDGTAGDDVDLPVAEGFTVLMGACDAGNHLVLAEQQASFDGGQVAQVYRLSMVDKQSGAGRILTETTQAFDVARLRVREDDTAPFLGRWVRMPDGAVVFATHFSRYELALARTSDQGEAQRLDRALEPRVRSDEEIDRLEQQFAEQFAATPSGMTMEFVPSEVEPLVSGVLSGPAGEIWVRRTQRADEQPDVGAPVARFDRHDAAGIPTGEVEFYGDAGVANQLMIVSGERVYVAVQPTSSEDETEVHVSAFELHER